MSNQEATLGDILGTALRRGECVRCGAMIYGSPNSQCPKCGEVNNPQTHEGNGRDTRFPTVAEQLNIPQVSRFPEQVERFAQSVETHFEATADMLIRTAVKLEDRAAKLRDSARWLLEQRGLANDIREAVTFERTSMEEVQSLALVDVGMRQEG